VDGFDNLGSELSLSVVRRRAYLEAADQFAFAGA